MSLPITTSLLLSCVLQVSDQPPIVLDGRFDDWAGQPTVLVDPADAGRDGLDLGAVKVVDDPSSVAFFIELGRTVNLQRLPGRLVLAVDEDGDPSTGDAQHGLDGADLLVVFTPPDPKAPAKSGFGVAVRRFVDGAWQERGPYAQPVAFAPTAAGRNAEIRIERDATTLDGERFRFRVVAYGLDGAVDDETAIVERRLSSRPAPAEPPTSTADPLARPAGTTLRVVSWNVERGGLISKPEAFARILTALQPDVLLFSELTDKESAAIVAQWLDQHVGKAPGATDGQSGSGWTVNFGAGGGNLRTAVASRRPLAPQPALERVSWSEKPGEQRDVRFASGVVDVDGVPLLACSIHLKCCGGMGTEEDLTRLEEVQAIRSALRMAAGPGRPPGAVVLGGDFNLVGSVEPLDLMIEGLDLDGTNLGVAEALQLDTRTAATWADPGQPFTPGRLDYVIFADSWLTQRGGFVLDTRDISKEWLDRHGLRSSDTADASDHLPVVVDLGLRAR